MNGAGEPRLDDLLAQLASAPPITPSPVPFVGSGRKLGHYRILERLGAGGTGVVYRAVDERLQRHVALKFLHAGTSDGGAAMLAEARHLASLQHPAIATLFDVGEVDGTTWLAMELVEGATLREQLSSPLVAPAALQLLVEIADALAHLHRAGFVHRDVKPENIAVSRGHAKLLDFGTARRGAAAADEPYQPVGTEGYIAPEPEATPRADVYAFGVMVLEVVARLPSSSLRARLGALGRACSAVDPRERPADGAQLCTALRALERGPSRLVPAVVAALGAVALGAAALAWARGNAPAGVELDAVRLTAGSNERLILDAVVSADGRTVAALDGASVALHPAGPRGAATELGLGGLTALSLSWLSATELVLAAADPERAGIWTLSTRGALERLRSEPAQVVRVSPDGRRLAWVEGRRLKVADAAPGSAPLEVATVEGQHVLALAWSPGSERLAFIEHTATLDRTRLMTVPVRGGPMTTLLADPRLILESGGVGMTWRPSGDVVYALSQSTAGQTRAELWALPVDATSGAASGPAVRLHTFSSGAPTQLSVSRDGELAYVHQDTQVDVWLGRWDAAALRWVDPAPLKRTGYQERPSSWSSGGERLWYTSDEGGRVHAAVAAPGSPPHPSSAFAFEESWPFEHAGARFTWRWSEGAASAELVRRDATAPDGRALFSVPLRQTGRGNQLPPTHARVRCASRADRCIAAEDDRGTLTLRTFDAASGALGEPPVLQLTAPSAYAHGWDVSPDGEQVATPEERNRLSLVTLATGERRTLEAPAGCLAQQVAFAADGRGLFLTAVCDDAPMYRVVHLALDGSSTLVFQSESAWLAHPLPSPDGSRFALAVKPHLTDVWLLAPRVK